MVDINTTKSTPSAKKGVARKPIYKGPKKQYGKGLGKTSRMTLLPTEVNSDDDKKPAAKSSHRKHSPNEKQAKSAAKSPTVVAHMKVAVKPVGHKKTPSKSSPKKGAAEPPNSPTRTNKSSTTENSNKSRKRKSGEEPEVTTKKAKSKTKPSPGSSKSSATKTKAIVPFTFSAVSKESVVESLEEASPTARKIATPHLDDMETDEESENVNGNTGESRPVVRTPPLDKLE